MLNYKKVFLFALILISILLTLIFWEKIKLPYDESNTIHGVAYDTKTNPNTNTLRFIFFSLLPILIFFFGYISLFKTLSLNINQKNFFLKKNYKKKSYFNLGNITFFLIGCVVIEFLFLNFNNLLGTLDIYHEATNLVPLINHLYNNTFWLSNFYEYGLWGNNIGTLSYKISGIQSIGLIRLFDQTHILLNKIVLILICNKISSLLDFQKLTKIIFFSFLTLIAINLTEYFIVPSINNRALIFLIFFFILLNNFEKNFFFLKNFLIGFFSLISFLSWIDIGFYINAILIFYLILCFFLKETKKIIIIFFGILSSWLFFIFFFGKNEFIEFLSQIYIIARTFEHIAFLEFPKPLTDHPHSFRGLKSLIIIIINGIFCVFFCLNKKIKLNFQIKICLILFFISSIIFFKSALLRSDSYHIKYGSGLSFLLFFLNLFLFFFLKTKFVNFLKKKNILKIYYIIFYSICFLLFIPNLSKNLYYNNSLLFNFNQLILKNENFFLKKDDIYFVDYFRNLSKNDSCVQVFIDYTSLPYLLKKPSCTKFFRPEYILKDFNENKFLEEFKIKSPEFILYSSTIPFMTRKDNMPEIQKYIKNNYNFYNFFDEKWVIYKKKN